MDLKALKNKASIYANISTMLRGYNNRNKLSFSDIDTALIRLEKLGINPTPF